MGGPIGTVRFGKVIFLYPTFLGPRPFEAKYARNSYKSNTERPWDDTHSRWWLPNTIFNEILEEKQRPGGRLATLRGCTPAAIGRLSSAALETASTDTR